MYAHIYTHIYIIMHIQIRMYIHTRIYIRVYTYKICKKFYIPKSGEIENYYYERNGNYFSSIK